MFGNDDEHIVKMWTPLHFTTGEDFNYFPKNPLFKLLNMTLRTVVYCVGPIILRLFLGLRVCGRENIKKLPRGGITVCNHVHILDCVMVACHMNPPKNLYSYTGGELQNPPAASSDPDFRRDSDSGSDKAF